MVVENFQKIDKSGMVSINTNLFDQSLDTIIQKLHQKSKLSLRVLEVLLLLIET